MINIRLQKMLFVLMMSFFMIFPAWSWAGTLMRPYLQAPRQDSIYVLVESDSRTVPAMVEYGKTPAYGLMASAEIVDDTTLPSYIHKIRISGLLPATKYHYRVIYGTTAGEDITFKTGAGPDKVFRFAFMADCHENTRVHGDIDVLMKEKQPDFLIYGGDICSSGDYNSFKNEFFIQPELDLISRVPFFLSPGNHEGWGKNTRAFTQQPDSGSGTEDYYSFDRGAAHFLVLNTEVDFSAASPQYKFAQSDLAATGKKWKIAVFHKPAYANGGDWWGLPDPTRELAEKVLSPAGVQLVLAGHMHYYQHNYSNGTHHLVVSSAGGYQENPVDDIYTIKGDKGYHYAVVDVDSLSLCVRVYNGAGTLVDTVSPLP